MAEPRRNNALVVALYVNAALLLAILAVLVARRGSPSFAAPAYGGAARRSRSPAAGRST